MEKLEDGIYEAWEEFKKRVVIPLKDVDQMEKIFANKFEKVARQRERLEKSRDMWKSKFMKLKNEK